MTIARQYVQQREVGICHRGYELPWWRPPYEEEDPFYCMYCGCWTDVYLSPGLWDLPFEDFAAAHSEQMKDSIYSFPPGNRDAILCGYIIERKACLYVCDRCGWWIAEDRAILPAEGGQMWVVTLVSPSVLQEFALDDIAAPIKEIRRYLVHRFEDRRSMHPRLYELTVASVFSDYGYNSVATAYSNDGGVDVVLENGVGRRVGIQVKQQRGAVGVEEIRALLGALILGDYTSGVFVCSSRFTRGAVRAAEECTKRILPIELVDADRFLDMLGSAQQSHTVDFGNCSINRDEPLRFRFESMYYLNSL